MDNLLGYVRRDFLLPVPRVSTLEELNVTLERHCRDDLQRRGREHPTSKAVRLEAGRAPALSGPAGT